MGPGHAPNRDLIEALDRQTATGEILRAISQSQTDTQPVFEAIADSALRLFRAWSTTVYRVEGQFLHPLAAGGGRLASPFSAREVYRQEWTGLTEPRVVQGALECLEELGWIRPEAVRAPDGGRPTVRFHLNPRLRADGPPRARRVRPRGAPKPLN